MKIKLPPPFWAAVFFHLFLLDKTDKQDNFTRIVFVIY